MITSALAAHRLGPLLGAAADASTARAEPVLAASPRGGQASLAQTDLRPRAPTETGPAVARTRHRVRSGHVRSGSPGWRVSYGWRVCRCTNGGLTTRQATGRPRTSTAT